MTLNKNFLKLKLKKTYIKSPVAYNKSLRNKNINNWKQTGPFY